MAERLSPEDSRILALESRSIVGHTCKVVIAERTGDGVTYLRDRIARRIALAPSCRRRIVMTPRSLDAPVWADDPNFDVRRHVRKVPVAGPVGDAELREIVAGLMAERLPRDLTQIEMRKLELARAMAASPKLLISAEAMRGLSHPQSHLPSK